MKKFPFKLRYLTSGAVIALAVGVVVAVAANPKTYTPSKFDSVKLTQRSGSYVDAIFYNAVAKAGPCTPTAATISGFGTNAAVTVATPACEVDIATGTASINGTIILPVAATGWHCSADDITTVSNAVSSVKEISTTTNTAVIEAFDANTAATNFVANDVVLATCTPY